VLERHVGPTSGHALFYHAISPSLGILMKAMAIFMALWLAVEVNILVIDAFVYVKASHCSAQFFPPSSSGRTSRGRQ
jgi:hypothetical protein